MGKFKCPHCGHTQNKDGVCEGCDISKVLPVDNTPHFIKGVRYKCNKCFRILKAYYDICPYCGEGKLIPQYKNHRQLKKSSQIMRLIAAFLIISALLLGAAFIIPRYFPSTAEDISLFVSSSIVELKSRFLTFINNTTSDYLQGRETNVSREGDISSQQLQPSTKPVSAKIPQPTAHNSQMFSLGDTATIGNLEFTVKSMVFSDYLGNIQSYGSIDSDFKYCVVSFDVYNPTNNTIKIREKELDGATIVSDIQTSLLFDREVQYGSTSGNTNEFFFYYTEIIARATLTDKVISFKVPVSIANSEASLIFMLGYKGNEITLWELR